MNEKGDKYLEYNVHGDGIDSIQTGFDEIGMPRNRHNEAIAIIREVLQANNATNFRWYKPPATDELSCYWEGARINMLWVTPIDVHVDVDTPKPDRKTNWEKQDGQYVGWLLPGANAGAGGGPKHANIPTVLCPKEFIHIPAGVQCPYCEVEHPQV